MKTTPIKSTRAEALTAAATLRQRQLFAEQQKARADRDLLKQKLEKEIAKLSTKKAKVRISLGWSEGCGVDIEYSFKAEELPANVRKDHLKYHALEKEAKKRIPDVKEIRKDLLRASRGLGESDTVTDALLRDPASKKAIEKMLATLTKK